MNNTPKKGLWLLHGGNLRDLLWHVSWILWICCNWTRNQVSRSVQEK